MGMSLQLITGSTRQVLGLEDIKFHLSIPTDDPTHDELLTSLEKAAVDYAQSHTGRMLSPHTYKLYLDQWPTGDLYDRISLPYAPLTSVPATGIVYTSATGDSTTFSSTKWAADTVNEPGAVVLDYNDEWPTTILHNNNPISVEYNCGYAGSSDVPESIKSGIKMLVGHWFENREDSIVGTAITSVPMGSKALFDSRKVWHSV